MYICIFFLTYRFRHTLFTSKANTAEISEMFCSMNQFYCEFSIDLRARSYIALLRLRQDLERAPMKIV